MSQFSPDAINFLLENEDSQHKYTSVADVGGAAISGVNSHSFPEQYEEIAAAPLAERPQMVADFYQRYFWNPGCFGGIENQDVANRCLDQAVDDGLNSGCVALQRAANACGCNIAENGHIGAITLEAVNGLDGDRLLAAYRQQRELHYRKIVAAKPELAQYLKQWIARAQK